jgi:hypothetical protein
MKAEEYVKQQLDANKDHYKSPEIILDEQIKLLEQVKQTYKDEPERMWYIATAVSEAYHVALYDADMKNQKRLVNTIISFVSENTV